MFDLQKKDSRVRAWTVRTYSIDSDAILEASSAIFKSLCIRRRTTNRRMICAQTMNIGEISPIGAIVVETAKAMDIPEINATNP
jgi:hypothetical protein